MRINWEEKLGVVMYRGDNLTLLEISLGEIMRWEVCEFHQGKRNELVRISARKGEKASENISKKERIENRLWRKRGGRGFQVNLNKLNFNSVITSKRVQAVSFYNHDYIPRKYSQSNEKQRRRLTSYYDHSKYSS